MSNGSDLRAQLQSLRIDKEQRPASRLAGGNGRVVSRPTRRMWRYVLLSVLVALTVVGYRKRERFSGIRDWVSAMAEKAAPQPNVPLITITPAPAAGPQPVLTATGKIVSDHTVSVSTKVSGQIVKLHFEQGDRVTQGQLLAEIEDVIYRARRDQAAAMLAKSRADVEFQKVNFGRVQSLHQQGDAPAIEYAQMTKANNEAKAQVNADTATLEFTQKQLDDCRVVAPIAGTILERSVEVGDFVAAEGGRGMMANAQFTRIADMSLLRVECDISELDITKLVRDMPCDITPDAYKDRRYSGHILWIDPAANYSKATVQVKVRILEPDQYLRVEGSAKVGFFRQNPATAAAQRRTALWIPRTACRLSADGKSATVFRAEDGRLKSLSIVIGDMNDTQLEVISGLAAGDRIVSGDLDKVTDGQRISQP